MSLRRRRLRKVRFVLVLALALAALCAQAGTSLALFTDFRAAAVNPFNAGTWAYYLHNNPTPPVANTTAQINLAMDTTVPGAGTLYRYSTDCAARAGRRLTRAAPSPTQAAVCNYENWRTPVLAGTLRLSGAITVDIWSASDAAAANRTGGIVAYLRDFNPAGAGTYTEIANGLYTTTYAIGRNFYHYPITVTVGVAYTLPVGHQLELKLVASNAYQANMLVAYDTAANQSFLQVR
jgi:predicted ribosomally synthesized peptide with SipW-like signal peptide